MDGGALDQATFFTGSGLAATLTAPRFAKTGFHRIFQKVLQRNYGFRSLQFRGSFFVESVTAAVTYNEPGRKTCQQCRPPRNREAA